MDGDSERDTALERLVEAAGPHVAFDGWSETTLKAAAADAGVAPGLVAGLLPRGAVDLAAAAHRLGDRRVVAALAAEDLAALRFRERITRAVRLRLELAGGRETVRRAAALFALPQHAAEGAALIWGTADAIWTALGDESRDLNWYSKRASLSAVYSATLLYWLGDGSPGAEDSWAFLDRRIADVMAFEKTKASFQASPIGKFLGSSLKGLERVRAPQGNDTLPGHLSRH